MASISDSGSELGGERPSARAFVALVLLTVAYAFNFMDRFALVAMVGPMKRDLHLTDGQIGLLLGFAFSLVYSVLGLPLAAVADRWGRLKVVCLSLAFWSLMTMAASRATGFLSLAATRFGVGVGEAGGTPPAHSMLAEQFKGRWLSIAMAVYSAGSGVGLALGLALGGALAASVGWRAALVLIGAPGVVLALVMWLAMARDGDRRSRDLMARSSRLTRMPEPGLLSLASAMGLAAIGGFAALAWLPTLGVRLYGEGGASMLAAALGGGNLVGILAGGGMGLVAHRSRRLPMAWLCALICVCAAGLLLAACMTDGLRAFVLLSGAMAFVHSMLLAPVMAQAQRIAAPGHGASASALVLLLINTLGAGGGPWLVGVLSDAAGGADGLRTALPWAAVGYLPAAALFLTLPGRGSADAD